MSKVSIPRRRAVTADFSAALTALCRAKGLDIKHCWPLAEAKRLAADEAKKFEDARVDAIERHNVAAQATPEEHRKFVAEVNLLLNEPVEFNMEVNSIAVADGALTGDVLEQVMEFVKRPE